MWNRLRCMLTQRLNRTMGKNDINIEEMQKMIRQGATLVDVAQLDQGVKKHKESQKKWDTRMYIMYTMEFKILIQMFYKHVFKFIYHGNYNLQNIIGNFCQILTKSLKYRELKLKLLRF